MKKSRLMELAGLVSEYAGIGTLDQAVKDKAAYKKFIEAIDILLDDWYAAGFTKDDIVDYMKGILPEGPGGIEENATNADDLKAAVVAVNDSQDDMTSEDLLGAIEDGYYALTDNLPNLINDIQKAIKLHAKINPKDMNQIKALQNELKIYKGIQALIDDSAFGTFL